MLRPYPEGEKPHMADAAPILSPHDDLTTGERLRLLRNRKHLSLRELAMQTGVHFTTLAAYERDEASPKGETLRRLAMSLGTSADYLLRLRATPSRNVGKALTRRKPQVSRPIQSPLMSIASQ